MQEVTIRLRFTRECLGYVRRQTRKQRVIYCMPRDGEDRTMFLASWWRKAMDYAAKVAGHSHELAGKISWSPVVTGKLATWQRVVVPASEDPRGRTRYALHEAFRPGTEVELTAVLPEGLTVDAFVDLLGVVGNYKGISPYQVMDDAYGTFSVRSVEPTVRKAVSPGIER